MHSSRLIFFVCYDFLLAVAYVCFMTEIKTSKQTDIGGQFKIKLGMKLEWLSFAYLLSMCHHASGQLYVTIWPF